jgi:hypothetical protein
MTSDLRIYGAGHQLANALRFLVIKFKQARQCTYKGTLQRVRATIVVRENQ